MHSKDDIGHFMKPKHNDHEEPLLSSSRRDFLKTSALAGLGTLAATAEVQAQQAQGKTPRPSAVKLASGITLGADIGATRPRPAGQKSVHNLTTKPLQKVRVAVIGCHRGSTHANDAASIEFAELVAVCDWRKNRAEALADSIGRRTGKRPEVYGGTENIWEQMVDRDDIDVVYIATPWEWHAPMALRAMQRGKHAFTEVNAAVSIEDCWRLVDTSERTQRHCVMIENCCYGENELFVLNMARQGVFGELNHGECAYIHDLRGLLFNLGSEGEWRRNYHKMYDGNLYPTHGLGPVAQYLGIGRGDQFSHLVSISSPERGLTKWRDEKNPNDGAQKNEDYIAGDMNTTMIKTALGRSILVQHDVISPRPYTRINMLSGTGATFMDYPARLAIDNPKQYGLKAGSSHDWLSDEDLRTMREKFTHPLWKGLQEKAKGGGHGGMDFVMNYRLLDCIRRGATPDMTVYDGALWSSLLELSSRSVALGSMPVQVPDFTRGAWKTMKPLEVVTL
jgi:hypothetical protein